MARKFRDFMREVEAEAVREGPEAVAELEALDAHFRLAGDLLALRRERGLTQRELAEKSGIQQSEISRIEAGKANPTMQTVTVLARQLSAEVRLVSRRPGTASTQGTKSGSRRAGARGAARAVRRCRGGSARRRE